MAIRSEEFIGLAKMWSYQYPLLVSVFPYITKKAERAVERYLSCFDGEEQCESEVAVGPPLLSSLSELKFADRNHLIVCLTPPSEPSFHRVQITRELATSVTERLRRWLTSHRVVPIYNHHSHISRHKWGRTLKS